MSTKVKVTTIKQAIDSFLLTCKVEGNSNTVNVALTYLASCTAGGIHDLSITGFCGQYKRNVN